MSPPHANKRGARYRYYISQAVLQKQLGAGKATEAIGQAVLGVETTKKAIHPSLMAAPREFDQWSHC